MRIFSLQPIRSLLVRTFLVSLAVAGSAVAAQAQLVDRIGVPGPVLFDGKAYALTWTSNPSAGYFKQEYLAAGQDVATYSEMILIDVLESGVDVKAAVMSQVAFLKQRKVQDSMANIALVENKKTGEMLLDFIISDNSGGRSIVEWNAYRYRPHTGKNGRKGVILFALSRRAYNDDIDGFLKGLRSLRVSYINKVAHYTLPAVATSAQP